MRFNGFNDLFIKTELQNSISLQPELTCPLGYVLKWSPTVPAL